MSENKYLSASTLEKEATLNDRMAKFKALQKRKRESEKLNRQEVYAEHAKQKEDSQKLKRLEAKKMKAEEELEKIEATERGEDYDRKKNLEYSIEDCEKWEAVQLERRKGTSGASQNYEAIADRAYDKDLKNIDVVANMTAYKASKERLLRSHKEHTIDHMDLTANKPAKQLVKKLVADMGDADARRMKRRRNKNEEDDVHSYINDKNKHFNMKLNREANGR
ncbi:hypothetical protein BABINDRAFT_161482 [Babjeviella inositovora NRRL Y-12698]|uniref:Pre-mRNA-splicing factor SYF2 n=1 Tax=Babjeviella inositovora NRRL Y-12698 TaxID=984486 RepID=A0A1E3QQ08_9ASCO|nr:uncharacterized protein BABINDRAFT_161482 [Babjeviella inositovora NRRL Y-12698]ODQ79789.1 hypothetical protein BABINDRAFT_161482 [Babjeviella inositovora NRRL Y-12698]